MMTLEVFRFSPGADSTLGILTAEGDFSCFTCEDEFRAVKVAGETRIPGGTYEIILRNEGGKNKKYAQRYPFHKGMLWLQDVPGFEWIYIHTGNDDDDSLGCILVGYGGERDVGQGGGMVSRSRQAYSDLYQRIIARIEAGEKVQIIIHDHLPTH